MKQSMLIIAFLGFAGVGSLVLLMMVGLDRYAADDSGVRMRLSNVLSQHFRFPRVVAEKVANAPELLVTYDVRRSGLAPERDPAHELDARRLYDRARDLTAAMQDADAAPLYDELKAKYPDTEACIDFELWDVACFARERYEGKDRERIERVRVVRREVRDLYGTESIDERTFTLDLPKPEKPK